MKCQYCECNDSRVIDSRPTEDGLSIRRRRECINCGHRFTTYEKVDMVPLIVVKRDGRRETFMADKIRNGIWHACDKLPVSSAAIEGIVNRVERAAYAGSDGEVSSKRIGDLVMEELKNVNDVAYVRFAAVYRKFTDLTTFLQELQRLVAENATMTASLNANLTAGINGNGKEN